MAKRTAPNGQVLPLPQFEVNQHGRRVLVYNVERLSRGELNAACTAIKDLGGVANCRIVGRRRRGHRIMVVTTKVNTRQHGHITKLQRLLDKLNPTVNDSVATYRRKQENLNEQQKPRFRRVHPRKMATAH